MDHYLQYMREPGQADVDDSPLYMFDGNFASRAGSAAMGDDYRVPGYFREDLFSLVGHDRRPPYRWLVFGPARTGASLHVDPLGTSAWNTVLYGTKRWVLFPPHIKKARLKPRGYGESAKWFAEVLPKLAEDPELAAVRVDCIQRAGDTLFVPGGWWHAALNLETTCAVTQNYACKANLARVWRHTRLARPKMSARWLAALRASRAELGDLIDRVEFAAKRGRLCEDEGDCTDHSIYSSPSSSSSSSSDSDGPSSSSESSSTSSSEEASSGSEGGGMQAVKLPPGLQLPGMGPLSVPRRHFSQDGA